MQTALLEQGNDGLVTRRTHVGGFHVEEGLGEIVLRVEVDEQNAPAERALPGAEDL